jgi:hypothetical protein
VAPCAQEHPRLVFRGRHHLRVLRLDKQNQGIPLRTPFLAVGPQRNKNEIILRLSERAPDHCGHADDFVAVRSRADQLADGINVGEKFLLHIPADEAHRRAMRFVRSRQKSSRGNVDAPHFRIVGGHSKDVHVLHQVVAGADIRDRRQQRSHLACGPHSRLQLRKFIRGHQWPFLCLYPGVVAGDDSESREHVNVGAKIGDFVGHIKIQARDHAHHRYQSRHREDHSQQRQEAPQLVRSQRVQG